MTEGKKILQTNVRRDDQTNQRGHKKVFKDKLRNKKEKAQDKGVGYNRKQQITRKSQ